MIKTLLTALLIIISLSLSAQEKNVKDSTKVERVARNEIKINLLNSVLSFPEINYERILKNNTSFGLAAFAGFENEFDYNYGVISYYRVYFSKSERLGVGVFIEVNGGIVNLESDYLKVKFTPQGPFYFTEGIVTNYGLGFATGAKFLAKNNFVGEVYVGFNRFLTKYGGQDGYLRSGITIGKRF